MAHEQEIDRVKAAFSGGTIDEQLAAVIALPDRARAAAPVIEAELQNAPPKVKVAILDALHRVAADPNVVPQLIAILASEEAKGDDGEELYMMARIALNRAEDDNEDVISGEGAEMRVLGEAVVVGKDRLAVVVHGTWASDGTWWRKGGDFHSYLLDELAMDYLYAGDEPFVWSGRNRDSARHSAAKSFGRWVMSHRPKVLDVYAHSHGANVAMLATHLGLEVDRLVMMSPPVRKDYYAKWHKVGHAFNIQASVDPVVGIARGGQWFNIPEVREKKLNKTGHSSSHDPAVWRSHEIPTFVGLV